MSNKNGKNTISKNEANAEEIAPVEKVVENVAGNTASGVRPLEDATAHIDALTGDMPQVVPEAVEAQAEALNREAAQTAGQDQAGPLDRYGRKFNADVHATTADGKPVLTRDGNISLKRGAKNKLNLPGDKPGDVKTNAAAIDMSAKRRAQAQILAGTFIGGGIAIFGDEWRPDISKEFNEVAYLEQATYDYLVVCNAPDLPPWMGLAVAYGSYAIKRINKPQTQTKLKGWFQAAKDKIVLWWFNRNNKKGVAQNATRPNTRDNGNGKNDVSVSVSPIVH